MKLLHKDKNNNKIYLEHDGNIKMSIPGGGVSKSIKSWVEGETGYIDKILVKEINQLNNELDYYRRYAGK